MSSSGVSRPVNRSAWKSWLISFAGILLLVANLNVANTNSHFRSSVPSFQFDLQSQHPSHSQQEAKAMADLDTGKEDSTGTLSEKFQTHKLGEASAIEQNDRLMMSNRHQKKFDERKSQVEAMFPAEKRYDVDTGQYALLKLNKEFAYRFIFKSGSTTVGLQLPKTRPRHKYMRSVKRLKKWMTLVRDPIDHFLSGWAECGDREFQEAIEKGKKKRKGKRKLKNATQVLLESYNQSYDQRVDQWLRHLIEYAASNSKPKCETHSLPQANFLLEGGLVHVKVARVGDVRELPAMLESVGFPYNYSTPIGRNATKNDVKSKYFSRRLDLISDSTMQRLCDFVALDYFLFDFEPPPQCHDQLAYKYIQQTNGQEEP